MRMPSVFFDKMIVIFTLLIAISVCAQDVMQIISGPTFVEDGKLFNITVGFHKFRFGHATDFIGVYSCAEEECNQPIDNIFQKVPLQYKTLKDLEGYIADDMHEHVMFPGLWTHVISDYNSFDQLGPFAAGKRKAKHTASFTVIVRPDVPAVQLAYVSGSEPYYEVGELSPPIVIPKNVRAKPRNFRLALPIGDNDMINQAMSLFYTVPTVFEVKTKVAYSTNNMLLKKYDASSLPHYLRSPAGNEVKTVEPKAFYSFNSSNLCELETSPAGNVGYSSLGKQVEVLLDKLQPGNRYYYKVIYVFEASASGQFETEELYFDFYVDDKFGQNARMMVFGDMGQSMKYIDGSQQHSFDNMNHGEVGAPLTSRMLSKLIQSERVDLINHIGDISYATGQLSLWDSFLHHIEPTSQHVPWMGVMGNHEMGWSQSDYPGGDSQGECGVPYMSLFPSSQLDGTLKIHGSIDWFPMNEHQTKVEGKKKFDQIKPWYSYIIKNVYVIVISTEHDMTNSGEQLKWIESELMLARKTIDSPKSSVDWLLFLGHRQMYVTMHKPSWEKPTHDLMKYIEPLLQKYKVDIAMWGHHHTYERFKCKVFNGDCVSGDSKWGVVQIISGAAGFDHTRLSQNTGMDDIFAYRDDENWGVTLLDFKNSSHVYIKFLENTEAKVLDAFWVIKSSNTLVTDTNAIGHK